MDRIWTFSTLVIFGAAAVLAAASSSGRGESAGTSPMIGATIKGKVVFQGKAPKDRKISVEGDKYCSSCNPEGISTERYVIGPNRELCHVFVYVKKGLEGRTFDPPKEAVLLDQKHCVYTPHVFGIMTGQELRIRNSDDTLHNIHATPKLNAEFNFGQPKKGTEEIRTFSFPEIMVPIKCDVHGWMSCYAGVVSHPFFQVTNASGTFELTELPAGEYEIEAWHEKFGTLSQTVKVGDGQTRELEFTFKKK
ncbi:MAG: carboxypeptidase regulatory-like domain-containing protein [Planctomycetes bacterium]|nr:carboxypeptidase regulatory-like domain-containing protein [Planctomycetota bacterium]